MSLPASQPAPQSCLWIHKIHKHFFSLFLFSSNFLFLFSSSSYSVSIIPPFFFFVSLYVFSACLCSVAAAAAASPAHFFFFYGPPKNFSRRLAKEENNNQFWRCLIRLQWKKKTTAASPGLGGYTVSTPIDDRIKEKVPELNRRPPKNPVRSKGHDSLSSSLPRVIKRAFSEAASRNGGHVT